MGRVVRVDHFPAQDLLIVRVHGEREVLVPFVAAIVPEVDVAAGTVVVTPPAGLFEDLPTNADADATARRTTATPLGGRRAERPRRGLTVRIDIVTIFPEFFGVLDVSLLGKARRAD